MFIEFSLLRIVGLFFQHRIIFFYTQQLEWNSQITFQLKPKYTHPSYTPFIVDSPYCVLSLSPTFIFTIMWLSNLLFISSKSSSQWSRLLSSWVVLMSLQLCVCFIFFWRRRTQSNLKWVNKNTYYFVVLQISWINHTHNEIIELNDVI